MVGPLGEAYDPLLQPQINKFSLEVVQSQKVVLGSICFKMSPQNLRSLLKLRY